LKRRRVQELANGSEEIGYCRAAYEAWQMCERNNFIMKIGQYFAENYGKHLNLVDYFLNSFV